MNMKKNIKAIAIFAITAMMLAVQTAPVHGDPIDDKKSEQSQVQQDMGAINGELQDAITRYDSAYSDLNETENAIAEKTQQLENCQADLDRMNQIMNERVRGMYKYGEVNVLEILFGSKNVSDLTEQFDLLSRISSADADLVRNTRESKIMIENTRASLEQDSKRQQELVSQVENEKSEIEQQLADKQNLLSSLDTDISRLTDEEDDAPIQSISRGRPGPTHGGVVDWAYAMIGVPYVYGGASPDGFDCSSLVWYCYKQVGVSLNRTCDYDPNVSWDELQPGDIVISHGGGHVGIYVGGGLQVHAPYSGTYVQEAPIYSFYGGYRP